MSRKFLYALLTGCALTVSPVRAEEEKKITFDEHIKPIFREHCMSCHNQADKQSDLALDSYSGSLTGGSSGEIVAEGNPSASRLMALINHAEQPFMPPEKDVIPEAQRNLIKTWIEQGMPENSGSTIKRKNSAAAAMLTSTSVGKPEGPPPLPETMLRQPVTLTQRSAAIAAMAASPWAPLIAVGGQRQVSLYHSVTGELTGIIPFPEGEPQSLTFTRDGKQLLVGGGRHSHSGYAVLVDVASGNRIAKVGDELDIVLASDISADKSRIAVAGPQKIVRIYDTFTGEKLLELKKHTDWVYALRFSPDGVLLASADRANGLVIWEAQSGLLYADLAGHKGEIRSVDFRPDSNVLASASMDGTVKLWDMFENKEVKSWAAHGGGATAVAFSQTGLIATSGMDSRVKVWNADGAIQKEFTGLADSALEVAFTGDGAQVAGGDWSGKVQVWQVADPAQTQALAANPPSIEQRLEVAKTTLVSVETEFNTVKQATDTVVAQSAAAQSQLTAAQQAAADMANKLAEATKNQQTLVAQATTMDKQIAEIEAQLSALKQQRTQVGTQVEQANLAVAQLTESAKVAQAAMAAAQAKQQEMAAAATAAAAKQAEADAKLAAARTTAEKAQADKVALDTMAAKLQQEAAEMTTKAQQILEQASATELEQKAKADAVAKYNADLKALQDQLAALQKQMETAAAAQTAAQQQLTEQEKKATDMKTAKEAAEAAALDAKEKLELFQQSYAAPK